MATHQLDGLLSVDSVFPVFLNFQGTNESAVWRKSLNPDSAAVWLYKLLCSHSWDLENPAPTGLPLEHSQS